MWFGAQPLSHPLYLHSNTLHAEIPVNICVCVCVYMCVDCSLTVMDGTWLLPPPFLPLTCWLSPMPYSWGWGEGKKKDSKRFKNILSKLSWMSTDLSGDVSSGVKQKESWGFYLDSCGKWEKEQNPHPNTTISASAHPQSLNYILNQPWNKGNCWLLEGRPTAGEANLKSVS